MSYFWALDDDDNEKENIDSFAATEILDATYEKVDINEVVNNQNHLNQIQKKKLLSVLEKYNTLFDGGLGHNTKCLMHFYSLN